MYDLLQAAQVKHEQMADEARIMRRMRTARLIAEHKPTTINRIVRVLHNIL